MCGRFTLTEGDVERLARELSAQVDGLRTMPWRPRYNLAPSDQAWIVRLEGGRRLLLPARFGFAGRDGLLANARGETAARLPTFRRAWEEGRCLVPADGFFEWRGPKGARQPVWLHPPGGGLILMAGLCQEGADGLAFTILTTAPNALVEPIHDRMPAILSPTQAEAWLLRPDVALLAPAPEEALLATPVSPRVNSVAHDDPECLAPAPEPSQGSLF
jgi:putative SOS response-associated peptidase YedK